MKRFIVEAGTFDSAFTLKAKTLKKIVCCIPKNMKITPPKNNMLSVLDKEQERR